MQANSWKAPVLAAILGLQSSALAQTLSSPSYPRLVPQQLVTFQYQFATPTYTIVPDEVGVYVVNFFTHSGNCSMLVGEWKSYADFKPYAALPGNAGALEAVSLPIDVVDCGGAAAFGGAVPSKWDGSWCLGAPLDVQVRIETESTCSIVLGAPSLPIVSPATPFAWGSFVALLLPLFAALACVGAQQYGSTTSKVFMGCARAVALQPPPAPPSPPPRVVYIGPGVTSVDGVPLDFPPPPPGLYYAGYDSQAAGAGPHTKRLQRIVYVYDPHGRLAHRGSSLPAELLLPPVQTDPAAATAATYRFAARRAELLQEAALAGYTQPLRLQLPHVGRPLPRALFGPAAAAADESEVDGSRSLLSAVAAAKQALASLISSAAVPPSAGGRLPSVAMSRAARVTLLGAAAQEAQDWALAAEEERQAADMSRKLTALLALGEGVGPQPAAASPSPSAAARGGEVVVPNPLRRRGAAGCGAAEEEPHAPLDPF